MTDPSGKQTAIIIDIQIWNEILMFNPDLMHKLCGNTFVNNHNPMVNIFTGEPINLLGTENFSVDGTEN